MIILKVLDFKTGKFKIPQNDKACELSLQEYIDRYEKKYLTELLGATFSDEFIADLINGVPQNPLFLTIFNPFSYDNDSSCDCQNSLVVSLGIKDMLMAFIFFEYMRDFQYSRTLNGVVTTKSENTENTNLSQWGIANFYNEGIASYQSIQTYIKKEISSYPNYKGISKKRITITL